MTTAQKKKRSNDNIKSNQTIVSSKGSLGLSQRNAALTHGILQPSAEITSIEEEDHEIDNLPEMPDTMATGALKDMSPPVGVNQFLLNT